MMLDRSVVSRGIAGIHSAEDHRRRNGDMTRHDIRYGKGGCGRYMDRC